MPNLKIVQHILAITMPTMMKMSWQVLCLHLLFIGLDSLLHCPSPTARANIPKAKPSLQACQWVTFCSKCIGIIVGIATYRSSIATHQLTKQTDTARTVAKYKQWEKFLDLNDVMTCFYASTATEKSSEKSLLITSTMMSQLMLKNTFISTGMNVTMSLFAYD
jgi:hypothetical protein